MSSDLAAYRRLLSQLLALIREGRDEGPEGDALRDEMDVHWYRLTPDEQDVAGAT